MIEAVAEMDDELTHKYLEGRTSRSRTSSTACAWARLSTKIIPVLTGSALKNKGIQKMLDAVVDYLPVAVGRSANHRPRPAHGRRIRPPAERRRTVQRARLQDRGRPVRGQARFFRVYSGTLKSGSYVYNASRIVGSASDASSRCMPTTARRSTRSSRAISRRPSGLKETFTGDTLADPDHPVILESMTFPEPVIEVKIEPKTKADQDKLGIALQRLAEEDPTFRVKTDPETGETLIAGMGELHLEVLVDRMIREFKVAANIGKPQVSYRETVRKAAEGNGRHVRQTGGKGQYGHAVIKLEPLEKGGGYEFVDKIVGGTIPREYIKPIDQGIREALQTGIFAGYPMVDVKVTLFDGSYHDVDSSEMAFKIAGSLAIKDAVQKADPTILEPVMRVEATMPEEFMGDVIGDLNKRRGHMEGMENRNGTQIVRAFVPLAEMFGYVTDLRSMTQGRASSSMEFSHYAEVPRSIAD